MADPRGFLSRSRQLPERRPVEIRLHDWREVYQEFGHQRVQEQASRCMDCGIPFCHNGCPLGNLIPEWNDLVYRQDWQAASERLHATNNFPEFTGRLCPAPCETACVLGINDDPVTIKQVEVSIIDRAWAEGWVAPQRPERLSGKTVAVIGSGPAGLAAAQQLVRAGHTVAVYERSDRIGGLLRYGIPEFKMEKAHLDRRIAQMEAEGVKFRPGVEVGIDITGEDMRRRYDAIVVAVGATRWRDLDIPGRHLAGVHQAMEVLPLANRVQAGDFAISPLDVAGKHVVIIGGGDTGADCLGTAHRQGAASVTQLEIMPEPPAGRPAGQPWPTYPMIMRTSSAHEEGGDRVFAVSTEEFLDDGAGRVRALRIVTVDASDGGFRRVEGSERELPADVVMLAMGFLGPEAEGLARQLGLAVDPRGSLVRGPAYQTNVEGVFVAGDAGRGQSLIVWAIAEGRSAAAAVDAYLVGSTNLPAPIRADIRPLVV
ncbi:MAG: glutamate synthase subunit beta [Actinomycetales bacterium]|nr:glutamate synthase subunit beta [Actinomycetales bacterium]